MSRFTDNQEGGGMEPPPWRDYSNHRHSNDGEDCGCEMPRWLQQFSAYNPRREVGSG